MGTTHSKVAARRLWALILVLMMLAAVMALSPAAEADKDSTFTLTILHHNDGESQLLGEEEFGGVARFRTLVKQLRRQGNDDDGYPSTIGSDGPRGVLVVSSGDNFLAGPEWNASLANGIPFYDAIALDLIRYDALTIGNHEFDFGPDVFEDFVGSFDAFRPYAWKMDPPFISANLDFSGEPGLQDLADRQRIAASTVVKKDGVAIGIVGGTTETLPFVSSPRNVGVNDFVEAVQAEIDLLTLHGVKIIILSSHLQGLNTDLEVLPMLHGVDIAIAGGGDELLSNPGDLLIPGDEAIVQGSYPVWSENADGDPVPVVTGPGNYRYLGRLVAEFNRHGELVFVNSAFSGPQRVSGVAPDAVAENKKVLKKVVEPVSDFVADLAATVIGTSEVALEGRRIPGVRTEETNLGNLMADSMLWQASELAGSFGVPVPDVSLQNGGGIRNDTLIPAGEITELTTFDIAPFSNFVSIVPDVSRDTFKAILENAVSQVEFVAGRFAQVGGFSFEYDPTGTPRDPADPTTTPGNRVVTVTLDDGTPIVVAGAVVPGADLTVATIDFLANGGDEYPFGGAPFTTIGVSYQQALSFYIQDALGGLISAADYPEGGEGRIVTVP
jgi:5'-nucleotidase